MDCLFSLSDARLEIGRALRAMNFSGCSPVPRPRTTSVEASRVAEDLAVQPWIAGWLLEVLYECAPLTDGALALCERVLSPSFAAGVRPDFLLGGRIPYLRTYNVYSHCKQRFTFSTASTL